MNESQDNSASATKLTYSVTYGDKTDSQFHYHEYYEIATVTEGTQEITVDNKDIFLEKGQSVILRAFDFHAFTDKSQNSCTFSVFVPAVVMQALALAYGVSLGGGGACNRAINPDKFGAEIIFSAFSKAVTETYDNDLELRAIAGETVRAAACGDTSSVPDRIRLAVAEMRKPENIADGLKVMRRVSKMSGSGLLKQMKRHYAISPRDYLFAVKMNYAYNLVRFSEEDLKTVSEKAGYRSFDAFCEAFSGRFGITPGKMRKG